MLTYSFENSGGDALYIYLYKCIKEDILSGTVKSGERLPSKRAFAGHLGVSTITIENAYALLQTEGYIYSEPKRGYFVSDVQTSLGNVASAKKNDLAGYIWSDRSKKQMSDGDIRGNKLRKESSTDLYADFSSNQTRRENFPFSVWAKLTRQIMADQGDHLLTNPPGGGIWELRDAIASHLLDFRDMHVAPEQIIVGAGTEYLYGLLIQLLGFDCVYALEDPGYQKIGNIYEVHGVACRYIAMDGCGMRPELLEDSGANVIHLSPSHHFPTGITMPISRRYELLGWAAREDGRYIIEDDYDSEFRMSGKPIPTLQSIDRNDQVIYINTFTKSLASTIRISYMVLPEPLLARYRERLGFYSCTVSNFEQYTLAAFIRGGYYETHINRMRSSYRRKRNALLDAIAESPLAERVTISEEDAGLHFLMRVKTRLSDEEILKRATQRGIRLTSLSHYYHDAGKGSDHTFVINYSNIEESRIPEAVRRLYESVV